MKFRIKSLDNRLYHELKEFEKLGYRMSNISEYAFTMIKFEKGNLSKEIVLWTRSNTARKFVTDEDGFSKEDFFTKEELKILDTYNWDIDGTVLSQTITDWMNT